MDFPCADCQYSDTCFWVLKILFHHACQQGRRKKKPQTQLEDFPVLKVDDA